MKPVLQKCLLFNLLCFVIVTISNAQTAGCAELPFTGAQSSATSFPITPTALPSNSNPDATAYPDPYQGHPWVFEVRFHIIRNSNGIRQTGDVGEAEAMNVIRDFNLNFNQFLLFFKYGGYDYLDDDDLVGDKYASEIQNVFSSVLTTHYIQVCVLDGNILENGTGNIIPGASTVGGPWTFFSYAGLTTSRIPSHELGHCFKLKHLYANCCATPDNIEALGSEHVIRDFGAPSYNALGTGDNVHDTPAARNWQLSDFNPAGYYVGGEIDYNNDLPTTSIERFYKYKNPRVNNLMNVHTGSDLALGYFFTPGQGKRMRWAIAQDYDGYFGGYSLAMRPLSVLYEPFEDLDIAGDNVVSVTDNGNGTAKVCRPWAKKHRWQKGFNYTFKAPDGSIMLQSQPNDLVELSGLTGNYSISIQQLNPLDEREIEVICTRGVICTDEEYIGGLLINVEVLGSMNMTVTQLTAIQAKDPLLFEQIMEKYYNVLKRITTSGAEEQQIIYKP